MSYFNCNLNENNIIQLISIFYYTPNSNQFTYIYIYILVKNESLIFYSFFQVESFNVGSICHGDTDDEEDNTDSDVGLSSRGALRNRIDKLLVSENLYE